MVYEIGYIILPTVSEEKLAPEVTKLKEILDSVEATVVSDEYPVLISLEYEMVKRIETKNNKFNQGYFGWIKFEANPEDIEKLKKKFDLSKTILRYMIISTVKENTIASKKPLSGNIVTRSSKTPKVTVEDSLPMDEQEVDQEIDKLVEDVNSSEHTEETAEESAL